MAQQNGQRLGDVIGIAVVKGDAGSARRQSVVAQAAPGFGERQDVEVAREHAHLPIETVTVGCFGKKRISNGQDAMIDEDGQTCAGTGG